MVITRAIILRRHGIKAVVFGVTDKTDYFLVPVIITFFYALTASFTNLPFPAVLTKLFIENNILIVCAIVICTASLVWFAITLKIFGKSFRVGIDEKTNDKLITNGTFTVSRNPIYIAFIAFFTGILAAYPNVVSLLFVVFLTAMVHRQVLREEKFLKSHYGEEYEKYCEKVRRYL
jgi:protein-S-isoprenylcysteine O-methyltransferase Ste14